MSYTDYKAMVAVMMQRVTMMARLIVTIMMAIVITTKMFSATAATWL